MLTIQTKIRAAADRRRTISLTFERESPDSDSPTVEVIYQIQATDGSPFGNETSVLVFLSATRTDTREPVTLTDDERQVVLRMAASKVTDR